LKLSCRPLFAASSSVDVFPLIHAGRGTDPSQVSGPEAERLAAGYIDPPELDESNSVALRFPAVPLGFCWETGISSRAQVGCWPDTCALAVPSNATFFFWATISSLSYRSMFGDSSSKWALKGKIFFVAI
jgi:hypothetical protein